MREIIANVQVNIPCTMLSEGYLHLFMTNGLNPEIGIDAAALDRFTPDDHLSLATEFREAGRRITLHGPFMDLSPGSPDPSILKISRQRLQQMTDLVQDYHPAAVVCHAGYDPTRYAFCREEWLATATETWSRTAEAVSRAGSRLVLENVYEHHPDEMAPLMEALSPYGVGLCLDIGHLTVFGQSTLKEWLHRLGGYIRHLHLHDNRGKHDDHMAMGNGTIEMDPLFTYLAADVCSPLIVTLEPHREPDLWASLRYLSSRLPRDSAGLSVLPAAPEIS